jgi:hypothetical protein
MARPILRGSQLMVDFTTRSFSLQDRRPADRDGDEGHEDCAVWEEALREQIRVCKIDEGL